MADEGKGANQSKKNSGEDIDDIENGVHDRTIPERHANQTDIHGNVETKGDFVGRDKNIQGDEVHGDKLAGDKIQRDKIIVEGDAYFYPPAEETSPWIGRCDFYKHIALPPNYVPRPDLLAEVRSALLADRNGDTVAFTSAIKMDVLHGMGGIGKSVMARALCNDPEVQAAFCDGILWATLGQTPDLNTHLRDWVVEGLGGTISENVTTLNSLKHKLVQLLGNRSCLLIVDDVWHVGDAEVFQVGGSNCRILITTRDAVIAEELGATIRQIPVMTQREALSLLKEWGGQKLQQGESETLKHIVERLGRLPLAIKLAGGQLRRQSPEHWLSNFDARKLKSRRIEDIHDSLEATFALSLDDLNDADRELYTSLAIFKEDEATPAVAIAKLWEALNGLDNDGVVELLHDLSARALLQLNLSQPQINVDEDQFSFDFTVTLHDLLRDFIGAELGKAGNLRAHQALLNAYRKTRSNGDWASASDDGYLYNHLTYHLDQIADDDLGAAGDLKSLFDNQAWLHARVAASNYEYDGYVADLMLVWHRAHKQVSGQIESGYLSTLFADCVYYALIRTSINSLADSYNFALVARAVETDIWSPSRALSTATRVPDAEKRSKFITRLLDTNQFREQSNGKLRIRAEEDGLAAARDIQEEWSRAHALAALAPQLRGEAKEQALQEGLAVARDIQSERSRAEALAALAPQLRGEAKEQALQEGLAAARDIKDERSRADVLTALAPQLRGDLLQEGLAAARDLQDEGSRAYALAALAPQLRGEAKEQALQEGLAAALDIQDEWSQARALAALAPQLRGEAKEQALQEGLATARDIKDEWFRAYALAALAPQLRGEAKEQALQEGLAAALDIQDEWSRADALAKFLPLSSNKNALVSHIQKAIADGLLNSLQNQKRDNLLHFLANDTLFSTTIFSTEILEGITEHIIEILYSEWEWL